MKFTLIVYVLLVSAGLTSICHADSAATQTKRRLIQEETTALRSCKPQECPVFYVRAFDSAFPIPRRFILLSSRNGYPQFTSPISAFTKVEQIMAGEVIAGVIAIGPLEELKKSQEQGNVSLQHVRSGKRAELFSLTSNLLPASSALQYVLVGSKEYIQIGDENNELAVLLMSLNDRIDSKTGR